MKKIIVIPCRVDSTRLPGKAIVDVNGKPLFWYTYRQAKRSVADEVFIASDDLGLLKMATALGCRTIKTFSLPKNGTERVAEAIVHLGYDERHKEPAVINLQVDYPDIAPNYIDMMFHQLRSVNREQKVVVTVAQYTDRVLNENDVKVVFDNRGRVLYCSRAQIPHSCGHHYIHIGIYGFRVPTLLHCALLPPSWLERAEGLEQLRWMENGIPMFCSVVTGDEISSINTPEDLMQFSIMECGQVAE